MQYTNKKLPKSEIKIEGELETDLFETYFGKALRKIGQTLELDGFRKGKIPENVILSKVPEIRILEEMAELALSEHYPKIIELENLDPIGRPDIAITKLARKNPLGFKIKVVVMPEIKLPDYKKIAKKIVDDISPTEKETAVSDEELENTIVDIRKSRAPKKHITNPDLETSDVSKSGFVMCFLGALDFLISTIVFSSSSSDTAVSFSVGEISSTIFLAIFL